MRLNKKIIAREWLYISIFIFIIGLIILPLFFSLYVPGSIMTFGEFFFKILGLEYYTLFVALFPYIIFQLIRSIIWSIMVLRKESK